MSLINPGSVEPNGTLRHIGCKSIAWGIARRAAERITGCSRLWSWLWDREFESLMDDNNRRLAHQWWSKARREK